MNYKFDLQNKYFTEQIITYIGNKRSLLSEINLCIEHVKELLKEEKLITADLFSGSGVVARLLKQHSSLIVANDLEDYSRIINEVYLSNDSEFDQESFEYYLQEIEQAIINKKIHGIISKLYAPQNDYDIKKGERVFYTQENALYIDSFRYYIDKLVPENLRKYFLALLITEASIHVNTSGVFKGFYKDKATGIGKFGGTAGNALSRIMSPISIKRPILSPCNSAYKVFQEDAIVLSEKLPHANLVYLDPPYNQHPYGSNYFMLNLILQNKEPHEISKISGIPKNRNHSPFNRKQEALISMNKIITNLNTDFILISYNNEGFISFEEMTNMLKKYGNVESTEIVYNTFRGSRNLRNRTLHTNEFLFLLDKRRID